MDIIILYTDIAKLLCLIVHVYRNLILRVPEIPPTFVSGTTRK